jgi:hypothetical protein
MRHLSESGTWIVVKEPTERGAGKDTLRVNGPVPECGKAFEFELGETQVFEVPLAVMARTKSGTAPTGGGLDRSNRRARTFCR